MSDSPSILESVLAVAVVIGAAIVLDRMGVKIKPTPTRYYDRRHDYVPLPESDDFDSWWDYACSTQTLKVTNFSIDAKQPVRNRHLVQPVMYRGVRCLVVRFNPRESDMAILIPHPESNETFAWTLGSGRYLDERSLTREGNVLGTVLRDFGVRRRIYKQQR